MHRSACLSDRSGVHTWDIYGPYVSRSLVPFLSCCSISPCKAIQAIARTENPGMIVVSMLVAILLQLGGDFDIPDR